jgi:plasmid stabilization system protein ParE
MIVRWTEQAAGELAEHYGYYRAHNPAAARRLRHSIMAGVNRLRDYPHMGKPGRVEHTRELTIGGTPFIVIYRVNAARVEILHLYHGRQNWQAESEGEEP